MVTVGKFTGRVGGTASAKLTIRNDGKAPAGYDGWKLGLPAGLTPVGDYERILDSRWRADFPEMLLPGQSVTYDLVLQIHSSDVKFGRLYLSTGPGIPSVAAIIVELAP